MIIPNYSGFRPAFQSSATLANDGYPLFQPASIFYRPFVSWDTWDPVAGITIDLTGSNDAVAYTDEWHHYLSDPAAANSTPRWEIVRADPSALVSRSARFTLRLTALGQSLLVVQSAEFMSALLRDVHLYSLEIGSDTYWSDLHRCAFAPASFTPTHTVIIT